MNRIYLTQEALADLERAHSWYEAQRQGLGDEFVSAVDKALRLIQQAPLSHRFYRKNKHTRVSVMRRFPYSLFYVSNEAGVHIIACFHHRQHRRRLRKRTK